MPVLRTIKNDYEFYHHQKLDILVAIDTKNRKLLLNYWKSSKGKKKETLKKIKVSAYKMIEDEEFQSLKIDFTQSFQFDAKELVKIK